MTALPELTGATERFLTDFASADVLVAIGRASALSEAWDRSADRFAAELAANSARIRALRTPAPAIDAVLTGGAA